MNQWILNKESEECVLSRNGKVVLIDNYPNCVAKFLELGVSGDTYAESPVESTYDRVKFLYDGFREV